MNADGPQMTGSADNESDSGAHEAGPGRGGILDLGGRIAWQGRPDQGLRVPAGERLCALAAPLLICGVAVVRVTGAAEGGGRASMADPLAPLHTARDRRTGNRARSATAPGGFAGPNEVEGVLAPLCMTQCKEANP